MKIHYNSPVILTFTFISTIVLIVNGITGNWLIPALFVIPGSVSWADPLTYIRLFTHIAGHANWAHLVGNFTLILLIGPMLEEKYGSRLIMIMMLTTACITGLLNVGLFDTGLLGASGVAFMLIILSSITRIKSGFIPLTFILIIILFLGKEIFEAFSRDNISQFAHIMGGICGSVFGFLKNETEDSQKL
jgi:membrane associated rhomboid family serine protease